MAGPQTLILKPLVIQCCRITKAFDASEFGLVEVPRELLGLTQMHLVHLQLQRNILGEVPASLALLSTLTHLDLSHNRLRTVPTSIGEAPSLVQGNPTFVPFVVMISIVVIIISIAGVNVVISAILVAIIIGNVHHRHRNGKSSS